MKKFLVMAILALSMVLASCTGVTGYNAVEIDETNATINGKHYDNVVEKCWKVNTWVRTTYTGAYADPEDNSYEEEEYYEWGTEFDIRKTWEQWKSAANGSISTIYVSGKTEGDFTMVEVTDRTDDTCYESYGQ